MFLFFFFSCKVFSNRTTPNATKKNQCNALWPCTWSTIYCLYGTVYIFPWVGLLHGSMPSTVTHYQHIQATLKSSQTVIVTLCTNHNKNKHLVLWWKFYDTLMTRQPVVYVGLQFLCSLWIVSFGDYVWNVQCIVLFECTYLRKHLLENN